MSNELINIGHRKEADGRTCAGVCKSWKIKQKLYESFCHDFACTLTVITLTSLTAGESCSCLLWTTSFPRSVSSCDCWHLCFPSSKLNGVTGRLSSVASLKKVKVLIRLLVSQIYLILSYQNSESTEVTKFDSTEPYGSLYSFSGRHPKRILHRGSKTVQDLGFKNTRFSWLMYQLTSKYRNWCMCQKH